MNMTTAEIKNKLVEKYKYSKYAKRARARIQEISIMVIISYSTYDFKTTFLHLIAFCYQDSLVNISVMNETTTENVYYPFPKLF